MSVVGRSSRLVLAALAIAAGACGDGDGAGGTPCDPLGPDPAPITLATVLGVGRHVDGTLHVVDRPEVGGERVFVSDAGGLQRQRVAGSGSGPDWLVFTITDGAGPFTLKLEMPAGAPVRMGVIRGPFEGKTFEVGQQGDVLAVLGSDALTGLPVRNLPGEIAIEYLASLEDGRRLLVTRPTDDWSYQDFRVFFGAPDRVAERRVVSVSRQRDGGTTTIIFDLEGGQATAYFPAPMRMEPSTLTVGGRALALALAPADTRPDGLGFLCR